MSDHKDKDTTESTAEFDLDSTVELDISKFSNVAPDLTDERSLDDDFDKTLNGLMEIDDLLQEEASPASEPDSHEHAFASETIGFDDLNASVDNFLEPAGKADEDIMGDDYMPETAGNLKESDDMFDLDISDLPDEDPEEENEFHIRNATPATDELPPLESREEPEHVIELTEDMLNEPEEAHEQTVKYTAGDFDIPELSTRENDLLSDVVNEFAEKNSGINKTITNDAETPELTTTETDFISAATGDVDKEEDIPEIEVEAVIPPQPETAEEPVVESLTESGSGRSNTIPLLFGILGIAAGGFGAWMAFDATGKIADLERRIQNMSATANDSQSRDITDIQQRLDKVERRLTGTPTIEAAAPLGAAVAAQRASSESVKEPVLQPAPITPQTPISSGPSNGDWVVNISSHAKKEMAIRENARLQSLGLNPEIHTARIKERTWYRIQITGFASKDEARAKLRDLQQYPDINGAWIGKR